MERDRYMNTIKFCYNALKLRAAIRDVLYLVDEDNYTFLTRKAKNNINKIMLGIYRPVVEKHIRERYKNEFEVEYKINDCFINGQIFFTLPPLEIYVTANRRVEEIRNWVELMEYEEGFMRGLQEGFRAWKAGVLNAKN